MKDEKVDAWMPLWIGAYLADTQSLSRDEHGGYLLLLMAYWRNKGPLTDRGNALANIVKATPAEWRNKLRPVLAEFFDTRDGEWSHGRANKELANAGMRKAAATDKAKLAAEARWGKKPTACSEHAPSIPQALHEDCPTPSPKKDISKASPSHPPSGGLASGFDEFWQAWPKGERKQDKAKCLEHWKRNVLHLCAEAILADVRVKRGTTKWQEGYVEAPLVYLRGKRWEDGVEPDEGRPAEGVHEWHETRQGVEAKAQSLGLARWQETEQWPAYRAKVLRAAGVEPRRVA